MDVEIEYQMSQTFTTGLYSGFLFVQERKFNLRNTTVDLAQKSDVFIKG